MALICALVFLASPYFFAYLEAERLLGWRDSIYRLIDPWIPLVMVLAASLIAVALPWFIGLFGDEDRYPPI